MSDDMELMPIIGLPKTPEEKRVYEGVKQIARKVAVRGLAQNQEVLFAVYCAGLYHGAMLSARQHKDENDGR
jgi:hypothetical protein